MSGERKYVVLLEPGVWTADWPGDPGRTTVQGSARIYPTKLDALDAIYKARVHRPFLKAKIMQRLGGKA